MATVTVRPAGVGTFTDYLIGGVGDLGDTENWQRVDEVSADDATTFLTATSSDTVGETYTISAHGIPGGSTINSVTLTMRVWCLDDPEKLSFAIQTDAEVGMVVFEEQAIDPDAWATFSSTAQTVNPGTSAPWTVAEIDALEIGTSPATGIGGLVRITQVYAVIDYDAPAATGRSWGQIIG